MARKRGGLAGFYDRNKGILQKLAPIAAGAIGGPMAGAAVGAAMRGLDRPGKSGIGFDVSEGLQGGISGYMGGQMGQAARSGIQGLLTARKLDSLAPVDMASKIGITPGASLPSANMASKIGITGGMGATPPGMPSSLPSFLQAQSSPFANVMPEGAATARSNIASQAAAAARTSAPSGPVGPLASSPPPAAQGILNRTPSLEIINRSMGATPTPNPADVLRNESGPFQRFRDLSGKAAQKFRENKDIIEMVGKYAMPPRESEANLISAEAARMKAETERMGFEDEKAQREARQRALQQYFMPLLGQIQQERQGMSFGPMYRG